MPKPSPLHLSRRERQIMEILYARGQATVAEVRSAMADAPGYSAVCALMRVLEEKGHLRHKEDGPRFVYLPTRPRKQAARSALRRLVDTFFEGSAAQAVAALLDVSDADDLDRELVHVAELIAQAKQAKQTKQARQARKEERK